MYTSSLPGRAVNAEMPLNNTNNNINGIDNTLSIPHSYYVTFTYVLTNGFKNCSTGNVQFVQCVCIFYRTTRKPYKYKVTTSIISNAYNRTQIMWRMKTRRYMVLIRLFIVHSASLSPPYFVHIIILLLLYYWRFKPINTGFYTDYLLPERITGTMFLRFLKNAD